jgi:hypothetical protein
MSNLKSIGKKIFDTLFDKALEVAITMLAAFVLTVASLLILYFRDSPSPRLIAGLIGAMIGLGVSLLICTITVVVAFLRERGQQPSRALRKQLAHITLADKSQIENLVMVCGVRYQAVIEGRKPAHIDFAFAILNMSLHSVSVDAISGYVTFHIDGEPSKPKLQPIIDKNEARNVAFRRDGFFVIRQDFETELERDYYLNAAPDSSFYFNSLKITLTIEGRQSANLKTADISFRKTEGQWLAYYEGYFIHANFGDQKIALARRVHNIANLSEIHGRGQQLLVDFRDGRPSVAVLRQWSERLKKTLYKCYGLSGENKFSDRGYSMEVPLEESEQSNWLYMTCLRVEDLIKEESPQSERLLPLSIEGEPD